MNSISKCYKSKMNKTHDKNVDCNDTCEHPKPGKVLLRCNNAEFGPTNITFVAANTSVTINKPIASVTVDTARLCNPDVLIDFAGTLTIRIVSAAVIATFNFTLYKTCKGIAAPIPLTTFTFSAVNFLTTFPDSRSLKFEYSSCDDIYEDCCTYILELTSISSFTTGDINASISGKLCALVVESPK
ncbi:DUF4489 domain-containing protein [Clostridium thailandense]|uniref:DUF4489 domain-containing protein n=1 Tax=Clostridium thailandense TaxID=2794346 RepID=UPI003988A1C2